MVACGYVTLLGLIGSLIYFLGQLQCMPILVLRAIGYSFSAVGVVVSVFYLKSLFRKSRACVQGWKRSEPWARCDYFLMSFVVLALALCAFGPPTDADSLDYHLGVPLGMLRQGGFVASSAWMHSRLIGLGEHLNLLGLAMGTDNLGAALSLSALIWLVLLIGGFTKDVRRRRLVLKLLIGMPVLLFLVPNQKAQLIASMALLAAFLHDRESPADVRHLLLTAGAVLFSCSMKYSFYVVALAVFATMAFRHFRSSKREGFLLVASMLCGYIVLLFPIHCFNFINYHNPVSPFLSGLFGDVAGQVATAFSHHLSEYSEGLVFPANLLLPASAGSVSTVLGVGVLAYCFVKRQGSHGKDSALLAVGCAVAVTFLCQRTSRFYVEAYLFAALALGEAAELRRWYDKFSMILTVQLLGVALFAALGAAVLFPGILSWEWRDKVMSRAAHEYAAMQELDRILPEDAVLFCDLRSHALVPRPFIAQNYLDYWGAPEGGPVMEHIRNSVSDEMFVAMHTPVELPQHPLLPFISSTLLDGKGHPVGTRNPFNNLTIPLYVYKLDSRALQRYLDGAQ
jgi:hypothetical protein